MSPSRPKYGLTITALKAGLPVELAAQSISKRQEGRLGRQVVAPVAAMCTPVQPTAQSLSTLHTQATIHIIIIMLLFLWFFRGK